ncbi:hypothetical protein MTR_6g048540 [Medicago truncatula]|uniref:Protein FAR1-RELATED SEQUENCE n=1 Tax=Medicago truncatula TaxID=3880 RepID=A0A072U9Z9_MEDTR|nr:hypothetical protein MTR_6g048540 [Medicago truncatula]
MDAYDVEISHENISMGSPNVGEELNSKPCNGMEFKTFKKVREFYNLFARKIGFGLRVRSTKPKRAILVCSNEGQHLVKSSNNKEIQDDTNQAKRKSSYILSNQLHLLVMQAKGVSQIPSNFILQHWTKDANKGINLSNTESNFDDQTGTSKILRRMHVQQEAKLLVDLAKDSDEIYTFVMSELSQTRMSAIAMKKSNLPIGDGISPLESSQDVNEIYSSEEEMKFIRQRKKVNRQN